MLYEKAFPQRFLIGKKLVAQLNSPLAITWNRGELHNILDQLQASTRVAILLDRRLDPNRKISLSLKNHSLRNILQNLAKLAGGELSVQPNYIYMAPSGSARKLRTLVASKREELNAFYTNNNYASNNSRAPSPDGNQKARLPQTRLRFLKKRQTLYWPGLTSPQELLRETARNYTLKIQNLDQVPHDLWRGGVIPFAALEQQLCTVLLQFNLTYTWIEPGQTIKIIPVPDTVSLTRTYTIPAKWRARIEDRLERRTGITFHWTEKKRLEFQGLVEDQEWLIAEVWPSRQPENLLQSPSLQPVKKHPLSPRLKQRRFTIKQPKVSVQSVLDELQKSGLQIEYEASLQQPPQTALRQTVDLDLTQATVQQLFSQLLNETGLEYEISGEKIWLKPAQPSPSPPE